MDVLRDVLRDVPKDVHRDVLMDEKLLFFQKFWGSFFDPKSLSIDLLVMVPDFFEITFD